MKLRCYYVALDDMINGLNKYSIFSGNIRCYFSSRYILLHTLRLISTDNDIKSLQEKLKVNSDCFKTKIKLLKELLDTSENTFSESVENWTEWLLKLDRLNIFTYFFDIFSYSSY